MVKWWKVDPVDPDETLLAEAAEAIRRGELVVYPTDTLYGLAADPANDAAVALVFRVKRREAAEALPLIAESVEQVEVSASLTPLARHLARVFWPGPLTLVVDVGRRIAPAVLGGEGTIAVRVPAHGVARGLARLVGSLVTATSANVSGRPAPALPGEALAGLDNDPAVGGVIDAGPTPGGPPSTIVDARGARPILVREGAIPFARVVAVLEIR